MYDDVTDHLPGSGGRSHGTLPNLDVTPGHISVLANEVVEALAPRSGGVYIDGTFGGGGHTRLLAERIGSHGRIICIDRDPETRQHFDRLANAYPGVLVWVNDTYANMDVVAEDYGYDRVDGVLLDLGLSSFQLGDPERGFSFMLDGPLDMRFDPTEGVSAADLLNTAEEREIVQMLFDYGEEHLARRIARAIVRERERTPIETTRTLADLIEGKLGRRPGDRIHPATKTFQALRIAVNGELGEVERGLAAGLALIAPGGRFAVISFHSLEDRIVKRAFADAARGCICPREVPVCVCGRTPMVKLVGKPMRPSEAELAANSRARSATLRIAERLP